MPLRGTQRKKRREKARRGLDRSTGVRDGPRREFSASTGASWELEDAAAPAPEAPAVRVIGGGIKIEDTRVGTGAAAKHSSHLEIAYEAWVLRDDGTVRGGGAIDKATAKEPYLFVCGSSEVVKGLSLGIKGMRAGGKRTITVPWKFGYGAKGSLPSVPPKADLRFDVELLEVGAGFAV
ncbi:histone peptidyl-prolyl isomerase [Aureococcus anophagefferens]|uniref:peptidylprolyl isomerase n=2 Tax=Aureococcus anophagefferens TaxID=44056 RepID=A0ABR1FSL7_AURAN